MKRILVFVLIVLLLFSLSACAFADSQKEIDFFEFNTVEAANTEFLDGAAIFGFDVDADGNCLLLTKYSRDWYVNVYSRTGVFQYGIHVNSMYDYCRAFYDQDDRLSILFVKEYIIIAVDRNGKILELYRDDDREVAAALTHYDEDGESSTYEIEENGIRYTLSVPGYLERLLHHAKRQLVITDENGSEIIVYQTNTAENPFELNSLLFTAALLIAVAATLIVLKKKGILGHLFDFLK